MTTPTEWQWCHFDALSATDLYAAIVLRQQVFVVEQACLYLDADGRDPHAFHLLGWATIDNDRVLMSYARVFPPGTRRLREVSIGRVVTDPAYRGGGAGRNLMLEALRRSDLAWPGIPVHLDAQAHLEHFYCSLGFVRDSDNFAEDGIAHVGMVRGLRPPGSRVEG